MAKAYAPPAGYEYEYPEDWHNWQEHDEKYTKRLRQWCKDNTTSRSELVGETIQFPIADGYAVYMVFQTSPLELIHVPTGDAWQADACTIRGLRLKDVKERLALNKKLKSLFG